MDNLLKGNFQVKRNVKAEALKSGDGSLESEFEASALEKLGGSIAFVKKSSSFIWKGK